MRVIQATNVEQAFREGIRLLHYFGVDQESRSGVVRVADGPVTTVYKNPRERVLFNADRDANPFFHFLEALWMLGGRNDVAYMETVLPSFAQFSDDGETFHGAYGARWREHFDDYLAREEGNPKFIDQLSVIIIILKTNPDDRRAVLTMWDPSYDLGNIGKDFPCNTHIYFSRNNPEQKLDMTVCCRSNDIIWGAYGANVVHMSILQEVMAAGIGCEIGGYWQISNNFHGYHKTLNPLKHLIDAPTFNPYMSVEPYQIVNTPIEQWFSELKMFLEEPHAIGFRDSFFRKVALPIYKAMIAYRHGDEKSRYDEALLEIKLCAADDWRTACISWLTRRKKQAHEKRIAKNLASD